MKRIENDAYYTRSEAAVGLLWDVLSSSRCIPPGKTIQVYDPCWGFGHLIKHSKKWAEEKGIKLLGAGHDIRDLELGYSFESCDATHPDYWKRRRFLGSSQCEIVSNPPYTKGTCEAIVKNALESGHNVSMLLRITWLEPCVSRKDILADYADRLRFVIPVSPRIRFREDTKGSDSTTVAWFCWRSDFSWKTYGLAPPFIFARLK